MSKKISLLATALVMALPAGVAFGQSDDLATCSSMLETAVGHRLQAEGLDTSHACDLTISQLAQIRTLLDEDGMGSRQRIEVILAHAAE